METSESDFDKSIFSRLMAEQKKYIYNEEKFRIEESSPFLSKQAKIYIDYSCLGCVVIYFGAINIFIELLETGQWKYIPQTSFFETLGNSAIMLIFPFLASLFITWPLILIYVLGVKKYLCI